MPELEMLTPATTAPTNGLGLQTPSPASAGGEPGRADGQTTVPPVEPSQPAGRVLTDATARLAHTVETMREMSRQTDPQAIVAMYAARVQALNPNDGMVSVSRRNLAAPLYRITRSSRWAVPVNPWKQNRQLPVMSGGLLGRLLYGGEPVLENRVVLEAGDPAAEHLEGYGSLVAIPHYENGEAINMVVLMRRAAGAYDPQSFPDMVWMSNLFGRATSNLVVSEKLREALTTLDEEFRLVGELQRGLLPAKLPEIPGMGLAARYLTSTRAGGDYYDFFALADGRWGILIADVSGHGPPAAVLMAITHAIAHGGDCPRDHPSALLAHLNDRLVSRYTRDSMAFVTAFYGVYDPVSREIVYASAGHPPPRVKRCLDGRLLPLDASGGLPLGILAHQDYPDARATLVAGDQLIFYTDGITERFNPADEMFGEERLDACLANCALTADGLLGTVMSELESFANGRPADDDQTILVAKLR